MADVNNFDVMKAMSQQNKDIRLAPLNNILRMQKVKAGTQVTIGVEGDVIGGITAGRFVGGFIICDKDQFDEMKAAIRKAGGANAD